MVKPNEQDSAALQSINDCDFYPTEIPSHTEQQHREQSCVNSFDVDSNEEEEEEDSTGEPFSKSLVSVKISYSTAKVLQYTIAIDIISTFVTDCILVFLFSSLTSAYH